jgi:dipeptidase
MKKLLLLSFFYCFPMLAATNFLITKGASEDGVIIGCTNDGSADPRIVHIPAKFHHTEKMRFIYLDNFSYPRHVGSRAKAYNTDNKPTQPIGSIFETAHTYGYIEGNYGIMNEHQLAFGECTNLSKFTFDYDANSRIMGVAELTRLALERCIKAKEAILFIGKLVEEHGFYGDGETLLVADTEEGWDLEISCSPTGKNGIWVAKKIPDGEIFVAANQFRIQEFSFEDPNILYSKNLMSIAKKNNWLSTDKKSMNWQRAVCPGENHHPYSSLRRVWRLLQKINPSLDLSPWVEDAYTTAYPFSIKPKQKISIEVALNFFRDHYEGTEFDMTKGLAAGPYGCPNRNLDAGYESSEVPFIEQRINKGQYALKKDEVINDDATGAWERAISIPYMTYSYITQSRKELPDPIGGKIWLGFGEAFNTCYIPCYVGASELPSYFYQGNAINYDTQFGGLPFKLISNWITQCYFYAIEDVKAKQLQLERAEVSQQASIESNALNEGGDNVQEYLTSYCKSNTEYIMSQWWDLFHFISSKYCDGCINIPKAGQKIGYPQWWKDSVGYKKGPTSYHK